ncbi:MAG: hypothetical protein IH786_02745, partial [Proteobacteria bacterium]|nr:hypothetical protein [Pseudomonadota bacterium]
MIRALEDGTPRTPQRDGGDRRELGRLGVHVDHHAPVAQHLQWKLGSGIDRGRSAGHDHAVGATDLVVATFQDVGWNRLTEVNGVALAEVTSEQRSSAKAVNFGIIYGQSAFGLARSLGIAI